MASMKLEDLELWQELNEHELEVIQGGDDKSMPSGDRGNDVPGTNKIIDWKKIEHWPIESKRRLYCVLISKNWHFC